MTLTKRKREKMKKPTLKTFIAELTEFGLVNDSAESIANAKKLYYNKYPKAKRKAKKELTEIAFNDEVIKVGTWIRYSVGSDSYAYKVTKLISPTVFEVVSMTPHAHEDWKPEIIPGGYAGHCTNQYEQKWTYTEGSETKLVNLRTARWRGETYKRIWWKGESYPT